MVCKLAGTLKKMPVGGAGLQLAPDNETVPLVQVASALPENPEVMLVAAPVLLCAIAPYEYEQLPLLGELGGLLIVPAAQFRLQVPL